MHKNAVIIPINNICKPYFIMLSSLILARYAPSIDRTANVRIIQPKNAILGVIKPKLERKKGEITAIAAIAGETPSTSDARITAKR